jgi:hypothetical protein
VLKPARKHTDVMPRRRRSWRSTIRRLLFDVVTLVGFAVTSRSQLVAENLFLRKQLELYQERRVKPRRLDPATRVVLVLLSGLLDWRALLTVVLPDTLIRWHRQGCQLLWRWKSRPGRPPIPRELQRLILSTAQANPTLVRTSLNLLALGRPSPTRTRALARLKAECTVSGRRTTPSMCARRDLREGRLSSPPTRGKWSLPSPESW